MAPTRSQKRKSTESTTSADIPDFPAAPKMVPIKSSPSDNRSSIRKRRMGITLAQKQALVDNLQLEGMAFEYPRLGHELTTIVIVTERARKLRAQYMLQAQGARSRIGIRVNRIPTALRKAKMGDLLIKHSQPPKPAVAAPLRSEKIRVPSKNLIQAEQSSSRAAPSQRGQKRTRYVIRSHYVIQLT